MINQLYLQEETNRLFAASPDGGLWVTDINSVNWRPISDFLDNLEIRAFGVSDRIDLDVIYLVNKRSSLFKTTNAGASWTKLTTLGANFGRVNKIIVYNPALLYMATTTGLYRSSNSGSSWTRTLNGDVRDFAFDPEGLSIIHAGVRGVGLFKTTNGGTTWINTLAWDPDDSLEVNPCCFPLRTGPSQTIKISLGEKRRNGTLETSTNRTVAVKFGNKIFVSPNGGNANTFLPQGDVLITSNGAGNYQRSEDYNDNDWCNTIAVDPWNSENILVGQSSLFITTDGGDTWVDFGAPGNSTNNIAHEDLQDIQFSRTTRNLIFAANDGGVERSTSSNPTFSTFYTNLATSQLFRAGVRGGTVVANSDHNGLIGTTQLSGGSWGRVVSGGDGAGNNVCGYGNNSMERSDVYSDPKRPNRFYFFFDLQPVGLNFPPKQIGRVNYSLSSPNCNNNTSIFMPFSPFLVYGFPEKPQQPIAVDTRDGSNMILVATDVDRTNCNDWNRCPAGTGHVYNLMLTRNGNVEPTGIYDADDPRQPTWESTEQSVDDPFVSVAFVPRELLSSENVAYAITRSGALFTAANPPFSIPFDWTRHNGFVPAGGEGVRHFVVLPSDDETVFAITKNSFARTTNAGASWMVLSNPIPTATSLYSILHHRNSIGQDELYIGASDGVYRSTNGGSSWVKRNGNLPNVKVTQLVKDGNFLYAVTFGRGLWRLELQNNVGVNELAPVHQSVVIG